LQVLAYVVSGVGFLGAGVIMREQGNVRGINTAATLWGSAALGPPFRDMEIKAFSEQRTEIETSLLPVSLQGTELDTLMGKMKKTPGVQQVFWRASTTV
jgi:hypothetical protein